MNIQWLIIQHLTHLKTFISDLLPDKVLAHNNKFQNIHRNDRCFILGSGHSIKEHDLSCLADEIVFTQNHFHAHEQIKLINPTYHVNVPKYQPKQFDADWRNWLKSMDDRLPQKTILFFGKNTKYLVDEMGLFKGRAYYMDHGYRAVVVKKAPIDITRNILGIPTVLTQCLAIALFMGFKQIYLVGFDLDQVCRMQNREQLRFYGLSPITSNEADIKMEQALWRSGEDWINYWSIWRQCHMLKYAAEQQGITIINATRGGLLDMFERKVFEDLFWL